MTNLFSFDYTEQQINNLDGTASRFGIVFGENGNVIHTKKEGYKIIKTSLINDFGNDFINSGYNVTSFTVKHGEKIGLTIEFGNRATEVGDINYKAIITIPNNGNGVGFLSLYETRLICTNGMTRSKNILGKNTTITIPHNNLQEYRIKLMAETISAFTELIEFATTSDSNLNAQEIDKFQLLYLLNHWFYNNELPISAKKELTLNKFREMAALNPNDLPFSERYFQLLQSKDLELSYNNKLDLKLSKYTAFAVVTNYLSRRRANSKSSAPTEEQLIRQEDKVNGLLAIL